MAGIYNIFKIGGVDGTFDLDNDTLMCALFTSSYIPDVTSTVFADLTNEVSGVGYTSGGIALSNVTLTETNGVVTLDADDPSWTDATITARYAVIYKSGTANSLTDPLICYLDFGDDKGVIGGTFNVVLNASGILTVS